MYPYNPTYPNQGFPSIQNNPQQNMLPPQQILQANGKSSVDAIRMAPNSSALIADSTAPIVWKCVSDSLGNVTAEAFDITPHKDEAQVAQENMNALIYDMNERLKRLEVEYEQSITRRDNTEQSDAEHGSDKTGMGYAQKYRKPSGNAQSNTEK